MSFPIRIYFPRIADKRLCATRAASGTQKKCLLIGIKHYVQGYQVIATDYNVFQLLVILDGELEVEAQGIHQFLQPGEGGLLRLGAQYRAAAPQGDCHAFSYALVGSGDPEHAGGLAVFHVDDTGQTLTNLLVHHLQVKRPGLNPRMLRALSDALALHILYSGSSEETGSGDAPISVDRHVQRAKELLHATVRSGKQVQEVLSGIGLSYRQLTRHFIAATGLSPKQYQLRLRLDEARQLLEETDDSATVVALELGFASSQHFSRQFKSCFKQSPCAYRAAMRARSLRRRGG